MISNSIQNKPQDESRSSQGNSDTPIYDTLKRLSKHPVTTEKKLCVERTVQALMSENGRATWPVLLLGKIQCGKTDTFEHIIGLAFDKGFDLCIVMTKGTKLLADQTLRRLETDFAHFDRELHKGPRETVVIKDILKHLSQRTLIEKNLKDAKHIIVCKKEATNLQYLEDLIKTRAPFLQNKRILVIDDEADFASCNYRSVEGVRYLSKIPELITRILNLPLYCRYLQVTATPYALFLQPDGYINLGNDGNLYPKFKPRHTELVPIHSKYIGGKQYFEESEDLESPFSQLHFPVSGNCLKALEKRNKRYITNGIASQNLSHLTHFIISYFMGAAIRCLQSDYGEYNSSCVIHTSTQKGAHTWESDIVVRHIEEIKEGFLAETFYRDERPDLDQRVEDMIDSIYDSYELSNELARNKGYITTPLPAKSDVRERVCQIFRENDYEVKVVNSDNKVDQCVDRNGQLELNVTANIFIGGGILDRGITIDHMLAFLYGRNPEKYNMDTVLQHARMYGARSMEDMAVMRFYTTDDIYKTLKTINENDELLRQMIATKRWDDQDENEDCDTYFNPEFIAFTKDVKPCASQKIKLTNVNVLKPSKRILPYGFQTRNSSEIKGTIKKIDDIVHNANGFVADDFFLLDVEKAYEIIRLIRSTLVYDEEDNKALEWDENDMVAALEYTLHSREKKEVYIHYVEDRNMSRLRSNGKFIDAPDDGRTDTKPSRAKATDTPVLILTRQNGLKDNGWKNTPFYWPVLILPKNIKQVMFALNVSPDKRQVESIRLNDLGIDDAEKPKTFEGKKVLYLTLGGGLFWNILFGLQQVETRELTPQKASLFIEVDDKSRNKGMKYKLRTDIEIDADEISGLDSYNNGVFPFVPREYGYILFRNSRDRSGSIMLVKLKEGNNMCTKHPYNLPDEDVLTNRRNESETFCSEDTICFWNMEYNIEEVVSFKLNARDKATFEEYAELLQKPNDMTVDQVILDAKTINTIRSKMR